MQYRVSLFIILLIYLILTLTMCAFAQNNSSFTNFNLQFIANKSDSSNANKLYQPAPFSLQQANHQIGIIAQQPYFLKNIFHFSGIYTHRSIHRQQELSLLLNYFKTPLKHSISTLIQLAQQISTSFIFGVQIGANFAFYSQQIQPEFTPIIGIGISHQLQQKFIYSLSLTPISYTRRKNPYLPQYDINCQFNLSSALYKNIDIGLQLNHGLWQSKSILLQFRHHFNQRSNYSLCFSPLNLSSSFRLMIPKDSIRFYISLSFQPQFYVNHVFQAEAFF